MPVHTNSIGGYRFLELQGVPYLRQEQLELVERDGVDGTGVRKLGKRGKPFQFVSVNYEESFATAAAKMLEYIDLVGLGPVDIVRNSIEEGGFVVLSVVERERYAIFSQLGGIQEDEDHPVNLECCHIVAWTLLG